MYKEKFFAITLMHISLFSLAINPERHYPHTPESFQLGNYETNFILTHDGQKLISWDFASEATEEKGVVIIACGDSGNMSYSLYYVKQLVNSGYRVITFDYRGFGKSSDFPINKDYLYYDEFSIDLASVLSTYKRKYASKKKIGIMAFSMGTIISTLVSEKESYDFLIAENYVLNPKGAVKKLKEISNRNFILPKNSDRYLSLLRSIECPMLLFSGSKDEITTTADSEIIANMRDNRNLITYNGGHAEGLLSLTKETNGDIYIKHIIDFLNRSILNHG